VVHGPWDIFLLTKKKVLKFLEAAWEHVTPKKKRWEFKTSKLELRRSLSYRKQPKRFEMVYFPHFAKQNAFATYPARRLNAPSKTSHRESPASPRICGLILRKNKSSLNGLPSWINYGVARLFSFSKFRQTSFSTRPGGTMFLREIAQSLSRTNGLSSLCGDIRSSSCGRINLKRRLGSQRNPMLSSLNGLIC